MQIQDDIERLKQVREKIRLFFDDVFIDTHEYSIIRQKLDEQTYQDVSSDIEVIADNFLGDILRDFSNALASSKFHVSFQSFLDHAPQRIESIRRMLGEMKLNWGSVRERGIEVISVLGQLSQEDIVAYKSYVKQRRNELLDQTGKTIAFLKEVEGELFKIGSIADESPIQSSVPCFITGEICSKWISPTPTDVFVGYQFASTYYRSDSFKKMISESLQTLGLYAWFPDDYFDPNHISCEICYKIQQVKLCMFEVSDNNPNVMFELGIAHMLGKAVVLLRNEGSVSEVPSDLAGLHRIEYADLVHCRDELKSKLVSSATLRSLLHIEGAHDE